MTPVDLEHPHGNADRDQGGAYPTQAVPERERGWQGARQVQERYRNSRIIEAEATSTSQNTQRQRRRTPIITMARNTQRPPTRVLRLRESALSERA